MSDTKKQPELSASQQYLRKVAPTGGALTREQHLEYRDLLIKEGHFSTSAADFLEALKEVIAKYFPPEPH